MAPSHQPTLRVRQLFDNESFTYTYLLIDAESCAAAIIDPVVEKYERDRRCIEELNIQLHYIMETHIHADHITGAAKLKEHFAAKIVAGKATEVDCADLLLNDGDTIELGSYKIKALATPGHTNGCMSYYVDGMAFTGDALFIRGTGRTDFQEGDAATLYESVTQKLFTLPDATLVYPAHDYNGYTISTIGEEKRYNPRLGKGKSKQEFITIMDQLNLEEPLKIDVAVPANMCCGYMRDRI